MRIFAVGTKIFGGGLANIGGGAVPPPPPPPGPNVEPPLTLPDITQKPKHGVDELKQRLIDTWDRILQVIIDKTNDQWQTLLRACEKAKGRHFDI